MEANGSAVGAIPPPPGVVPNFTNPVYISGGIIPISVVFLSLSTVLLTLRLYTRLWLIPPFRLCMDDCIVTAAWSFSVAFVAINLVLQNKGDGKHLWDLPTETFERNGMWVTISQLLYVPATALPKIAILIAYLRVFTDKKLRIAAHTIISITVGYMLAICLVIIFHCQPLARTWNYTIPGHCTLLGPYTWNAVLNVLTDFMVLLVPVPMLWKWKVPTRRKITTGCVFATGNLTCILSAVRTYYVTRMQSATDLTRAVVVPTSLSVAEVNLTVICGCLMVARPFLRAHFPSLFGIEPECVEHISPQATYNDRTLAVLTMPPKSKSRINTGLGGINTSARWAWDGRSAGEDQDARGFAAADVESGRNRGWPLRNDRPMGQGSRDNILA